MEPIDDRESDRHSHDFFISSQKPKTNWVAGGTLSLRGSNDASGTTTDRSGIATSNTNQSIIPTFKVPSFRSADGRHKGCLETDEFSTLDVLNDILLFCEVDKHRSNTSTSLSAVRSLRLPSYGPVKLLLGRHPKADILLDHDECSRLHAVIEAVIDNDELYLSDSHTNSGNEERKWFLTDLESVHGTVLNGGTIAANIRMPIEDGDEIKFASYPYSIVFRAVITSAEEKAEIAAQIALFNRKRQVDSAENSAADQQQVKRYKTNRDSSILSSEGCTYGAVNDEKAQQQSQQPHKPQQSEQQSQQPHRPQQQSQQPHRPQQSEQQSQEPHRPQQSQQPHRPQQPESLEINKHCVDRPETIRCKHILLKHKNCRRPFDSYRKVNVTRTLEDAMEGIKSISDELHKDINHFDRLALKHSECSSAAKGGDLGAFKHEMMQRSFSDAAFRLDVNELSEPIVSNSGVHLIFRIVDD